MKDIKMEGQINLFDLPQEIKPKETATEPILKANNFDKIINQYEKSCNKIVKTVSGALIVCLKDKSLYFNKNGIYEFDLNSELSLMPLDEIIVVNQDIDINDKQLKKLHEIKLQSYVRRKGDINIYLPKENSTEVITKDGWFIEWNQKLKYKEDELHRTETNDNNELELGDLVSFIYEGQSYIGTIVTIYNNGKTVNVSWNKKRAAFYYKCVTVIQKKTEIQQIKFIKDCTKLNKHFIKGSIFNVYEEQESNYIIFKDGVFYGTLKENCRKVIA